MIKTSQRKSVVSQARIYLDEYCLIERGFSEKTILNKKETLSRYFDFINDEVITLDSCKKYTKFLHNKGWQNSSIKADLKILKTYIHYLYKIGLEYDDWSMDISLPKETKKPLNIVPAAVAENIIFKGSEPGIYDHSNHIRSKKEHREALRFILRTGLRLSELLLG